MYITTLGRRLKHEGAPRRTTPLQAVQDRARTTLSLGLRWTLVAPQEDPSLTGGISWFQGYGSGTARLRLAWDQDTDAWPHADRCNMNAYEHRVVED